MKTLTRTFSLLGLAALLLLAFPWAGQAAKTVAEEFEAGNQHFDRGEFAAAREVYERLAAQGKTSSNLFYNLGNAWFRLDDRGRAILNYERALALEPGHADAAKNLAFVSGLAGAEDLAQHWLETVLPRWTGGTFALLAFGGLWAVLILGTAAASSPRFRTGAVYLGGGLLLLVTLYTGAGLLHERAQAKKAVLISPSAARQAAAERTGVVAELPAGTRVTPLSVRGAWTFCAIPGQSRGWIESKAIQTVVPSPP